jgi:protein-tyrosine-phosphatase
MAEAIGRALKPAGVTFTSAGVKPQPVDPLALRFLATRGIEVAVAVPRALREIEDLERYRVIVTLDETAQSAFPRTPRKAVMLHWSPASVPGLAAPAAPDDTAAYEALYKELDADIRDLVQAILEPEAGNGETKHA